MQTSLFDYDLPEELIAQRPAARRDESRLLVLRRGTGRVEHRIFRDMPGLLRPGDLLVLNDTRVLPARLLGRRATGASVEVLLLRRHGEGDTWRCLVRPGRRVRQGDTISFGEGLLGEVIERCGDGSRCFAFRHRGSFEEIIGRLGRTPLPPYIKRGEPDETDRERYQTVYAARPGAVAAPTAGLHFTAGLLEEIKAKGVETAALTLHVGLGTFRPVEADLAEDHRMDDEWFEISPAAAEAVNAAKGSGRRIVAVGTTVVRALESAWDDSTGLLATCARRTDLYIRPGFHFRAVDALLTNFHLPRSTLLMLVSAFAGRESVLAAYAEAVRLRYRFYSYGDCMMVF